MEDREKSGSIPCYNLHFGLSLVLPVPKRNIFVVNKYSFQKSQKKSSLAGGKSKSPRHLSSESERLMVLANGLGQWFLTNLLCKLNQCQRRERNKLCYLDPCLYIM